MRTQHHFHTYSEKVFFCKGFKVVQQTGYYPYGEPWTEPDGDNSYFFGGKERVALGGLGWSDFGPRLFCSPTGYWCSPDSKSESFYDVSPYIYCAGNPIMFSDPSGMSPVYSYKGDSIGCTKEGFTGMVLVYYGEDEINVSDYTEEELLENNAAVYKFNDFKELYTNHFGDGISKIITSVISHFEGFEVLGYRFSMSKIADGFIKYTGEKKGWNTEYVESNRIKPRITLGSQNNYEGTVENLASSAIVHEWFSHGVMHVGDDLNNHSTAYFNVMENNSLWDKTTQEFKDFIKAQYLYYVKKERKATSK